MAKKILFTGGKMPEEFSRKLEGLGHVVINEPRADLSEDELIYALKDINAFILGGEEKATEKVLRESSSNLEIVAFYGAGYESYIDLKAATKFGVAVSNTPAANARSVAEFTMGLILATVKRIPYLATETKMGRAKTYETWNLQGGTIGILGMGAVGAEVAYMAHKGFGMQVLYTSRVRKPNIEAAISAQKVELPDLMKLSDVVSVHASYSEDTVGIIGKKEIGLMKERGVLINTSRAELIDSEAIRNALISRSIWGAGFDVYYKEPVPSPKDDQFGLVSISDEALILTPHTAFKTKDAIELMLEMNINSIISVFDKKPDKNVINPEVVKM